MGLESYLFEIQFEEPVEEAEIINLFKQIEMIYLPSSETKNPMSDYRSYYFERRTQNGLTEANVLFEPKQTAVNEFSLRFSVLSPKSVIGQTFEILSVLNSIIHIKVYDTEISNHIYRELRKNGEVDQNFDGIENTAKAKSIKQSCYIPIDHNEFSKNDLSIYKRSLVLSNQEGEIIEGGSATIEFIERKGLVDRFIYWIKNEL